MAKHYSREAKRYLRCVAPSPDKCPLQGAPGSEFTPHLSDPALEEKFVETYNEALADNGAVDSMSSRGKSSDSDESYLSDDEKHSRALRVAMKAIAHTSSPEAEAEYERYREREEARREELTEKAYGIADHNDRVSTLLAADRISVAPAESMGRHIDDDNWEHDKWKMKLSNVDGDNFEVDYSRGTGFEGKPPSAQEVVATHVDEYRLLVHECAGDYETYCEEMGLDTESFDDPEEDIDMQSHEWQDWHAELLTIDTDDEDAIDDHYQLEPKRTSRAEYKFNQDIEKLRRFGEFMKLEDNPEKMDMFSDNYEPDEPEDDE